MKIEISQALMVNEDNHEYGEFFTITKTFESNVVPRKGEYVGDSLYENAETFEVKNVTYYYDHDCCYVTIAPLILGNIELVKRYKDEIAPLHKWESIG